MFKPLLCRRLRHQATLSGRPTATAGPAAILKVLDGAAISSSTSGSGSAGTVKVSAGSMIVDGAGRSISAAAAADSSGQTGNVDVSATDSISLSHGAKLSIENNATVDKPGNVTPTLFPVSAPTIRLQDASITAASYGNVAASGIELTFDNLFLDPSFITTSANEGNGGPIVLHGTGLLFLDRSQISTSVASLTNGNGGDINISVQSLVMDTGFIQANTAAAQAVGGNVTINADAIIASGGLPASATDLLTVNAAGGTAGGPARGSAPLSVAMAECRKAGRVRSDPAVIFRLGALVVLSVAALAAPAAVVGPIQQGQQPAAPGYTAPPSTRAPFQLPPLEAAPPAVPEQKRVRFTGNTVISTQALAKVAASYVGERLGAAEIEDLRRALTRYYIAQGYVNSGALLVKDPAAERDGTLTFRIVEGRLSRIDIRGLGRLRKAYVTGRLSPFPDEPLNLNTLRERFQLLLEDPLFARINARLMPGDKAGEAVLDLDVARARPYQLTAYFNNYRPPAIGEFAAAVSANVRDLTGFGDSLDELNITPRNDALLRNLVARPHGLLLVVGPTGSGKTTTLHALLHHLNTSERKIWTAEDPVEITQPGLQQVAVQPKTGVTFANAMRAFLRGDPDVIMVGEMRDKETAATAVEASLTGHLVLSTLHSNSTAETLTRLFDMGVERASLGDSLLGVLSQRLVRRLCKRCKRPLEVIRELLSDMEKLYGEEFAEDCGSHLQVPDAVFRHSGCEFCQGTGYSGRVAVVELLGTSPMLKELIIEGAQVNRFSEATRRNGMRTLLQDQIGKALQGYLDIDEMLGTERCLL